jgi:hypothetical protein
VIPVLDISLMAQPPYFMGDYGNSRQDLPLDIPYDSIHQHYEDPTSVTYIPRLEPCLKPIQSTLSTSRRLPTLCLQVRMNCGS